MRLDTLVLTLLAACGAASQPAGIAGSPDGGARALECPVTGSCIPCGAQGNELKVGEYCTRGGGQCDDNGFGGNAILCAIDFREDAPPMCTRACRSNSDCGSGAVCTGDPADPMVPTACVPVACAAGMPGISPDAGTSTAAAGGTGTDTANGTGADAG